MSLDVATREKSTSKMKNKVGLRVLEHVYNPKHFLSPGAGRKPTGVAGTRGCFVTKGCKRLDMVEVGQNQQLRIFLGTLSTLLFLRLTLGVKEF